MKIVSGSSGPLYPDRSSGVRNGESSPAPAGRLDASSPAADRVEISSAGRARAREQERAAGGVAPVPAGAADRMSLIVQRIQDGTYNTDAVQAAVAGRILDRGDA